MTDKPTRQETLMRLEDKVTALWGVVCSADFVFQNTIIEEGMLKDDRVVIDMSEDEFSALSYLVTNLYCEAKSFKEFFYAEWERSGSEPKTEGGPSDV
jgi:hypothetical protein